MFSVVKAATATGQGIVSHKGEARLCRTNAKGHVGRKATYHSMVLSSGYGRDVESACLRSGRCIVLSKHPLQPDIGIDQKSQLPLHSNAFF